MAVRTAELKSSNLQSINKSINNRWWQYVPRNSRTCITIIDQYNMHIALINKKLSTLVFLMFSIMPILERWNPWIDYLKSFLKWLNNKQITELKIRSETFLLAYLNLNQSIFRNIFFFFTVRVPEMYRDHCRVQWCGPGSWGSRRRARRSRPAVPRPTALYTSNVKFQMSNVKKERKKKIKHRNIITTEKKY